MTPEQAVERIQRETLTRDAYNHHFLRKEAAAAIIAEAIDAATADLRRERIEHFADVRRLREWFYASHKPAHLAFTAGPERSAAILIEDARADLRTQLDWYALVARYTAILGMPAAPLDDRGIPIETPVLRRCVEELLAADEVGSQKEMK